MKLKASLAALAVMILAVSLAQASNPPAPRVYDTNRRTAYIASALNALNAMGDDELRDMRDALYAAHTGRCRSAANVLSIRCLIQEAQDQCAAMPAAKRESCALAADVLVTNRRSTGTFIPAKERHKLSLDTDDYRGTLFRELRRHHALLASEMGMSETYSEAGRDPANLASVIDNHCRELASRRPLSWQQCTAAIVWFVGTSERALESEQ